MVARKGSWVADTTQRSTLAIVSHQVSLPPPTLTKHTHTHTNTREDDDEAMSHFAPSFLLTNYSNNSLKNLHFYSFLIE